jgi:phage shock protein E
LSQYTTVKAFMGVISVLFGNNKSDFKSLLQQGALIVDVRSPEEFASGHVDKSINIPLADLYTKAALLKANGKPVITCCHNGDHSRIAERFLKTTGIRVYNGGTWDKLRQKIQ